MKLFLITRIAAYVAIWMTILQRVFVYFYASEDVHFRGNLIFRSSFTFQTFEREIQKAFILPLIPLDAESGCVLHLQFLICFLAFSASFG